MSGGLAGEGDLQETTRKEGEARAGHMKAFSEGSRHQGAVSGAHGLGEVSQTDGCWGLSHLGHW